MPNPTSNGSARSPSSWTTRSSVSDGPRHRHERQDDDGPASSSAAACAHGLTTGLFTSPHLASVVERFEICGEPIAEETFGEEFEHLTPFLRTVDERVGRVTYFEALTALGYLVFADARSRSPCSRWGWADVGRDEPRRGDVAVICPIGLDHPELGR